MICEECQKTFTNPEKKIDLVLFGYCEECGMKLKYQGLLSGYVYGIGFSGVGFYILLLGITGGWQFIVPAVGGPLIILSIIWVLVLKQGKKKFLNKKEYRRFQLPQKIIGVFVGFSSILGWFFLSVETLVK